ncbi:MAG: class II glutamine amidotransferase [Thermoplasmatota archaeon]
MCRHAAAIGPQRPLSDLLTTPPHSLRHQGRDARELLLGHTCGDGFGVAWYDGRTAGQAGAPDVYRSGRAIWEDRRLGRLAARQEGAIILAHIRDATLPTAPRAEDAHPYTAGSLAFCHNGYLADFHATWKRAIDRATAPGFRRERVGATDSAHLFALLRTRLHQRPEDGLAGAVDHLVRWCQQHAERTGSRAQLNFLVSDGQELVATRDHAGDLATSNSLYARAGDAVGEVLLASEALDPEDDAWRPVPDGSLLRFELPQQVVGQEALTVQAATPPTSRPS